MATEKTIRRETETPASDISQPAKAQMGQKLALVTSLTDSGSSRHADDDDDAKPMRETETPPASGISQPAKAQMGQKMALVISLTDSGSSRHVDDDDDDAKPMDKERSTVSAQESMDVDDYVPPPPLRIVRPESLENGQEKCPGFHNKEGAKKTSTCLTSKRRRGRPSSKSKVEQKPALFDSSCGSSSYSKDDKDDDYKPPTPTRKRRKPSRSKSSKRKMEQEPLLVDSSSSTEGKEDREYDFEPEVSDDDGRKKYARAEEVMKKLPAEGPSFVKLMLHSHVVKVFWLALPAGFCRKDLPEHDVDIVLEDVEGQTCKTKYLADKTALSGGWKRFAEQHDLKIGDTLVFQLVQPTKFKRENKFSTIDGALGLLSLDSYMDNKTTSKKEEERSNKHAKCNKIPRKNKKKVPEVVTRVSNKPSNNDSENLASEEAAGDDIRYQDPYTGDFVAVKSPVEPEEYEKLKLEWACAAEKVRTIELRLSALKDYLKELDALLEVSARKKKDQAVWQHATAPW
ncbi:unnamed protein product [Alopecurus aequalis]